MAHFGTHFGTGSGQVLAKKGQFELPYSAPLIRTCPEGLQKGVQKGVILGSPEARRWFQAISGAIFS